MDACKSMHALDSTNQTESFQGKLIFFGGGVFVFGVWFLGIFGGALCCYTNNFGEVKPSQVVVICCWLC